MKESANILPHLDDYLLMLQTNNYSQRTVYAYERDLRVFENFLRDAGIAFTALTKLSINNYKAYLTSIDRQTPDEQATTMRLESRSINRALSVLRSYLKYLIGIDVETPVPPEAIRLVKTERKHARVAEMSQLVALIEAPRRLESNMPVGVRNCAMLEVLFSTGMRISELLQLNRAHIDDTGRIFIRGKGKKERFVYLTPRAIAAIDRYLALRKDSYPALFIPYRGSRTKQERSKEGRRISATYLQGRIHEYCRELRINVPTSAHSLRHGFATYLAEQGANPAAIQILLGHESLNTTTRYVHASDRYAEKTHRKFHPLQQKSGK